MTGYTLKNNDTIPLSGMVQISRTNTRTIDQQDFDFVRNGDTVLQQASLFYAGRIYGPVGAFAQWTYDGIGHHSALDNTDIRAAWHLTREDIDFIYGVTVNNNPTVSDVWNTSPAFGYPYAAPNIGVPPLFSQPVTITVEQNHVAKVEGGTEAETLRGFLSALAKALGEDHAYEIRAPHGGVHPSALVTPAECPDADYREFIASFHPSSLHMHLGQGGRNKDFPYSLHTACEIRGGTLTVGAFKVHDGGRMAVLDHPSVLDVAARTPDLPGVAGISALSACGVAPG